MSRNNTSPLIVALDTSDIGRVQFLLDLLDPSKCRLKVGKELFTAHGPVVIDLLHQRGFDVFLDLKFHDIPNTVAKACYVAAEMGVWMLNVHAMGGLPMLEAACEAVDKSQHAPILIGVTVLTSMDESQWARLSMPMTIGDYAFKLAQLAQQAGLSGVVCSAHEVLDIKKQLGDEFIAVTPGIRMETDAKGDQKRVMTPAQAKASGVDYMVMGRPITESEDPGRAVENILCSL